MQRILPEYNNMGLISQSIKALKKREVMQGRFAVWRNLNRNPERQDDDMNITKEQVQHAASLSKLKLDDAQQQRMIEDLADIIAFADQLNELNTDTIKATAQTLSLFNVFREDEAADSFERDIILSNAPEKDSGYYLVPKVVE